MQHFIFDLDGTITNPKAGILGGYHYAFQQLGFPQKPDEELVKLIGPPLRYVFSKLYQCSEEDTQKGIEYYKTYYYNNGGMYDAVLFDGMKELFQTLKSKNKTLHIATNKGYRVDKILEHFGVLDYFTQIEFYSEEKNVLTKDTMINNILQKENITDKKSVVMIGDRENDLSAAKNIGVCKVGVLYGFGTKEELTPYHPDFLVNTVPELQQVLYHL